jgi:hypothetical protein
VCVHVSASKRGGLVQLQDAATVDPSCYYRHIFDMLAHAVYLMVDAAVSTSFVCCAAAEHASAAVTQGH